MKKQKPFSIVGVASVIVDAVKAGKFSAIRTYLGVVKTAFFDYKNASATLRLLSAGRAYGELLLDKNGENTTVYVGLQDGKNKQPLTKISTIDGEFAINSWEQYFILTRFVGCFYNDEVSEEGGKFFLILAHVLLQWEAKYLQDEDDDEDVNVLTETVQ